MLGHDLPGYGDARVLAVCEGRAGGAVSPWRPKRPCRFAGCSGLSSTGVCEKHEATVKAERAAYDRARGTPAARGYGYQWQQIRKRILERDPVCTICGSQPATEVDHIVAKAKGGDDSDGNLRGACRHCHSSKTAREDTPAWQRRPR